MAILITDASNSSDLISSISSEQTVYADSVVRCRVDLFLHNRQIDIAVIKPSVVATGRTIGRIAGLLPFLAGLLLFPSELLLFSLPVVPFPLSEVGVVPAWPHPKYGRSPARLPGGS